MQVWDDQACGMGMEVETAEWKRRLGRKRWSARRHVSFFGSRGHVSFFWQSTRRSFLSYDRCTCLPLGYATALAMLAAAHPAECPAGDGAAPGSNAA